MMKHGAETAGWQSEMETNVSHYLSAHIHHVSG